MSSGEYLIQGTITENYEVITEDPIPYWVDPRSDAVQDLYVVDKLVQEANPLTINSLEDFSEFQHMLERAKQRGGDTVCLRDPQNNGVVGYITFSIDSGESWTGTGFGYGETFSLVNSGPDLRNVLIADSLIVAPDYQGKGYGSMLMKIAEQASVERGCSGGVALLTSPYGAEKFYINLGYSPLFLFPISYNFGRSVAMPDTLDSAIENYTIVPGQSPMYKRESRIVLHKSAETIRAQLAGRRSAAEAEVSRQRLNNELREFWDNDADFEDLEMSRAVQVVWEDMVKYHLEHLGLGADRASSGLSSEVASEFFLRGLLGQPSERASELPSMCDKHAYIATVFGLVPEMVADVLLGAWDALPPHGQERAVRLYAQLQKTIRDVLS